MKISKSEACSRKMLYKEYSYTWSGIKSRIKKRPKTKVPNLKNQD